MMRTTVSTQPQIIIVVCCITLRRSAYDTAGNIRSITKDGTVTKSFGYTNASWPDLLTSVTANGTTKDVLYEGQSQTSDLPSSGNPITYYNGKDYTFTWTKGRQLASATVDGKQVSYTYDMSGARSGKQVYTTSNQRTTTYTYTTLSGKVMRQQWETRNSDDTVYQAMQSLEFVYDDGNQPFAMIYKHGQTTELYYYVLNAQGDVIALLNSAGSLVASYNYGAWGNYSVHGADGKKTTDATFIGHINPLRYRGYYYDRETRLYYLQSRYYDFANCRFINADTFATTDANGFLSANMFAYCENNPVMRTDEDGEIWHIVAGALIGGVISYASARLCGQNQNEALKSALWGAASGAVSAALPNAGAAVGVLFSVAESVISDVKSGESAGTIVVDAFISAGMGVISGAADDFISTKQATTELKSLVKSIPKFRRSSSPKVRIPIKRRAIKFGKRAGKSIFSMLGWGGSTSYISNKATNRVRSHR